MPPENSSARAATDSVLQWVHSLGLPERREELKALVDPVAREGGTPLVVASSTRGVLGVIQLKDVVKPGMRDRFDRIRAMGIKTVMITGDNRLTAQAIAAEAGVGRLPCRSQARGQAAAHSGSPEGRPSCGHVRRRHQRRSGAGQVRTWGWS